MNVDARSLHQSLSALCTKLAELYPDGIPFGADYYWSIPDDELLQIDRVPSGLTLGSVVDDMEDLGAFSKDRERVDLAHALMHASGLLRVLSKELAGPPRALVRNDG